MTRAEFIRKCHAEGVAEREDRPSWYQMRCEVAGYRKPSAQDVDRALAAKERGRPSSKAKCPTCAHAYLKAHGLNTPLRKALEDLECAKSCCWCSTRADVCNCANCGVWRALAAVATVSQTPRKSETKRTLRAKKTQ
jgi:hypothetical protein